MASSQEPYQKDGHFTRPASTFRHSISPLADARFPAQPDRYVLYVSPLCPWAHRTLIVRHLKGLEALIAVHHVTMGSDFATGWIFPPDNGNGGEDPLHPGVTTMRQLYERAAGEAGYTGRVTVPVLWDTQRDTIVNNESSEIIRMLYTAFDEFLPLHLRESTKEAAGGGLFPERLSADIDAMNEWVYDTVNNGVYKAGFATAQAAHDDAVTALFASLDRLEAILQQNEGPYLFGKHITEADVRLYTTLVRFDVAYHGVFLCNKKSVRHDYTALYLWLRRLYWDRDEGEGGEARGAFYKTTAPYLGRYGAGYAAARHLLVMQGKGALIVPAGPAVLIDALPQGQSSL